MRKINFAGKKENFDYFQIVAGTNQKVVGQKM